MEQRRHYEHSYEIRRHGDTGRGLALTGTAGQAYDWNTGAAVGAAVARGPYNNAYNDSYARDSGPGHYGYGYASRGGANYWARSRSLNHGQGPGCIQSPASLEYTGCD